MTENPVQRVCSSESRVTVKNERCVPSNAVFSRVHAAKAVSESRVNVDVAQEDAQRPAQRSVCLKVCPSGRADPGEKTQSIRTKPSRVERTPTAFS